MVSTHDASRGHENFDDASHFGISFKHFGAADMEQTQKLIDGWLQWAKQAKMLAQQTKLHPQHIHDRQNLINFEGDDDFCDDTYSGSATQELYPSLDSYEMAAIYLLIGDLIFP